MALDARNTCFDARLLRGLVGTTVTTYELVSDGALSDSISLTLSTQPFHATNSPTTPSALAGSPMTVMTASSGISRTWVITEKLSERAAPLTDHDFKMGRGSAKTVGKFLCHLAEDPSQRAFMRIHQQIPTTGTEDADSDILAGQAVPPGVCGELESFKLLRAGRCKAVPRFLGYAESTQGDNNPLPGGYIRYLVWEKVPGEPLTKEFFWSLDDTARREIRSKFRVAFKQVISCGTQPGQCRISKIIFDQSTGNLHISGFRRAWPVFGKLEWTEVRYAQYGLAKPGEESDWYLHPSEWQW